MRNSEGNRLIVLSLELHIQTRGDLLPDPNFDPIAAIAYVARDYRNYSSEHERYGVRVRAQVGQLGSGLGLGLGLAYPDTRGPPT